MCGGFLQAAGRCGGDVLGLTYSAVRWLGGSGLRGGEWCIRGSTLAEKGPTKIGPGMKIQDGGGSSHPVSKEVYCAAFALPAELLGPWAGSEGFEGRLLCSP